MQDLHFSPQGREKAEATGDRAEVKIKKFA